MTSQPRRAPIADDATWRDEDSGRRASIHIAPPPSSSLPWYSRVTLNRLWKRGSEQRATGPVHVSMNDYLITSWRDVPRVAAAGMRLRRGWPTLRGSVGLWFVGMRAGRRQISVSVWRGPEDLQAFVRTPQHRRLMTDFRDAGVLYTTAWVSEDPNRNAIWAQARDVLRGRVAGVPHH